jgi:hypothetical protein
MNDLFILGAGFSKAVSLHMPLEIQMPLLSELAVEVEHRLALNNKKHPVCDLFPKELELWLSFLLDDHPWLTEGENLQNREIGFAALRIISNRLFVAEFVMVGNGCPEWFTKLVEYWRSSRASVLTLNYDSLVERCAASSGMNCQDLYPVPLISLRQGTAAVARGPAFTLFKMHGSSSWFYSGAESALGEPIYYLPYGSWEDQVEDSAILVKDKRPFIVPPRFNKATYFEHETVHRLWSTARSALNAADRVFVLGYSLPPADLELRYFLASNCRRNQQELYLADIEPGIVARFSEVFGTSRVCSDFVSPGEPIAKLADDLSAGRL